MNKRINVSKFTKKQKYPLGTVIIQDGVKYTYVHIVKNKECLLNGHLDSKSK
jgi:hypothetical protein